MSWITGAEILERWGGIDADLIDAFGNGLWPCREYDRALLTPESRCFRCSRANSQYMPGESDMAGGCIPIVDNSTSREDRATLSARKEKAMRLHPDLTKRFLKNGDFIINADSLAKGQEDRAAIFLKQILSQENYELLFREMFCSLFRPLGIMAMSDRLKAAKFRLSDVQAFEGLHGIGRGGAGQVEAPESIQPEVEHEPTNAAEYAAWRMRDMSIHRGQIMLEIQERWGKTAPASTRRRMRRAEIAQIVLEPGAPPPCKDTDIVRWMNLEFKFKNYTTAFKRQK